MSEPNLLRKRKPQNKQPLEKRSSPEAISSEPSCQAVKWLGFNKLLTGLVLLVAVVTLLYRKSSTSIESLPSTYALCSKGTANIYTVDSHNTAVQCLLVRESRILYTGSLDGVKHVWSSTLSKNHIEESQDSIEVPQIPLPICYLPRNAIVVPGMSDSHGHILEYGTSRLLPLDGAKDSTAVVDRVRNHILRHPDILNDSSRLIEGWGWDHTIWPVAKFPSYKELEKDPVLQNRPIILQSKDGHAQWISKALLEQMPTLPDSVDGGVIVRDEEGNVTGVFLDKAQDLIRRPSLTYADRLLRFERAVNDALSKGLTSLHDAGFDPASFEFFKRQSELGNLPIRIYGMRHFNEKQDYWGDKEKKIIDQNRLTSRSVKIYADGALRSGGAALFEPYSDNPETSGFMRINPSVLFEFVPKFIRDGWQVNIHAIGDRANSIVLDAIESAMKAGSDGAGQLSMRPRIEHAQVILPKDAVRLAQLGVIASIQPTHVVSDMWFGRERLGPERVKNLYPYRTIVDAGGRITLGSDFPVEDMNPLAGIHAAITRLSADGRSPHGPGGWFPNQRLTRLEALRGFTIDPAYASFTENHLGSLEPGKMADYTVLSRDIMAIPVDEILQTKVVATVIDGRIVFGSI